MKMNFKGLVSLHTLPKTRPLLPLYEAVINSIQSIEDAQITDGRIEIIIERERQLALFEDWETDVENIAIVDNGIGLRTEIIIPLIRMPVNLKSRKAVRALAG